MIATEQSVASLYLIASERLSQIFSSLTAALFFTDVSPVTTDAKSVNLQKSSAKSSLMQLVTA